VSQILLLVSVTALTYVGVDACRWWAQRRRMIDVPNERSSHTQPTPRGGGLAIVAITLAGMVTSHVAMGQAVQDPRILGYLVGASVVGLVSWMDDIRSLPSLVRLAAHAIGAAVAILALGHWTDVTIPGVGSVALGWLGLPLTAVWVIGLTNAYNFMDGIDGIAAGQGVVAGLAWAVIGSMTGQGVVSTLGLLLAATCLGFLAHNWPPARIFMGDVGSAFLGYSFAVLPLLLAQPAAGPRLRGIAPVLGCLVVWPFVLDAAFTFLRRLARRENVLAAHRSHVYQRLVIGGYSHRRVTSLYAALAVAGAVLAVILTWRWDVTRSASPDGSHTAPRVAWVRDSPGAAGPWVRPVSVHAGERVPGAPEANALSM
jgi:UDP-N-acetylmuramyl pentapeptide phosphotransferase/UDP-N-acetylglucosamine-1-phosphate transferase